MKGKSDAGSITKSKKETPFLVERIKKIGKRIELGVTFVCVLMFCVVFISFCIKIVARYVGHGVAWADDLSVVFFIWILFLANAFIVDDKKQIVFDIVFKKLKGRTRFGVDVFRTVLVLMVFAAATPGSLDYIHFLTRERTSALEWRLDWVYSCFGIFMIATIVRQVFRLGFLIKNSPQPFQK